MAKAVRKSSSSEHTGKLKLKRNSAKGSARRGKGAGKGSESKGKGKGKGGKGRSRSSKGKSRGSKGREKGGKGSRRGDDGDNSKGRDRGRKGREKDGLGRWDEGGGDEETPGAKGARGQLKRKLAAGTGGGAAWKKVPLTPLGTTKKEAKADDAKTKILTPKQKARKEVTKLYSELINPGRSRKAEEIVGEILKLLEKRSATMLQMCAKKIGSRVIQACLKWGSREQRRSLLVTLKEHLPKLTVDRYGHMVALKLLSYISRTSTQRKPTAEETNARTQNVREFLEVFQGKTLHTAFYHRYGCRVINGLYFSPAVSTKEKRRILHEVAVPATVSLTRSELPGSQSLRQMLCNKDMAKEQRDAMMEHLREAAEKAIDKELLGIDTVHLIFQAFCEAASEAQLRELADKCMTGSAYLLSSKPGAEALLRLLGVATAKQRRDFCRDLKGKFHALATNGVDYVVMIRIATTIDDTVLLTKTMLAEWMADLAPLCFDKYGHKVLAWMLTPDDPRLFSPYERACNALPTPGSLKAPETRRLELLRTLKAPLREVLLAQALEAAADIHAKDLLIAYLSADWDGELVEALVVAAEAEAKAREELPLLGSGTATTTLLVLLKVEPAGSEASLAGPLWRRCLEPMLPSIITSRCAFVLLAMLKHDRLSSEVLPTLRKQRGELEATMKAAEAKGIRVDGAKKVLSALDTRVSS